MHPGGFEPPTARFVAEYSIQLSYGCIRVLLYFFFVCNTPRGLLGCRLALRAVAYATLSSLVLAIISQTVKQQCSCHLREDGASGRIRTSDRSVRSRVLYPAELRMQMAVRRGFEPRMQLLTAYSLSRGAPSASRPPHQHASCECFEELVSAHRRCVGAHITFWDL